jgi:hypothetical protein
LPKILESFGLGVMKKKKPILSSLLQYSNTPKLIEIESHHDGLPSFGL